MRWYLMPWGKRITPPIPDFTLFSSGWCTGGIQTPWEERWNQNHSWGYDDIFFLLYGWIYNEHIVLPFNLLPLSLMSSDLRLVARMLMLSLQQGLPSCEYYLFPSAIPALFSQFPLFPQLSLFVFLELLNSFQRTPFFFYRWNVLSMHSRLQIAGPSHHGCT